MATQILETSSEDKNHTLPTYKEGTWESSGFFAFQRAEWNESRSPGPTVDFRDFSETGRLPLFFGKTARAWQPLNSLKKHLLRLLYTRDTVINKTQALFLNEETRHLNIGARLLLVGVNGSAFSGDSLAASIKIIGLPWWLRWVKKLPAMREMHVQFLGREDALEKGTATHSSILA